MSGIFLSYRRDDSAGHAGRLYDRLVGHFGRDRVFRDLDSLGYGTDFRSTIRNAISGCDALVAVIGNEWLTIAGPTGGRRLDDPRDFVRMELEAGLERGVPVIPVLVEDAEMPREEELPVALVRLCQYNAMELSDSRWDYDVGRLVDALKGWTAPSAPPPRPALQTKPPRAAIEVQTSAAPPVASRRRGAAREASPPAPAKRRLAIALLFMLVLVAAVVVAIGLGRDDPGQPAPSVETVVAANRQWTGTSVSVGAGEIVSVHASGTVRDDVPGRPSRVFGPNGRHDPPNSIGDPLKGANHCALIGKLGGGAPFLLGENRQFRATQSGVLFLGVNDAVVRDNDGSYRVVISVRPG